MRILKSSAAHHAGADIRSLLVFARNVCLADGLDRRVESDFGRLFPGIIAPRLILGHMLRSSEGINAVDYGQTEAAGSLGLRPFQTMRYVVLPQALRNILPPLGNEFIVLIKDSSLLSTIGIYELMNSAQIVSPVLPTINAFLCGGGHLLHLDVYDFATIEFMGKETRQRLSSLKGEDKL